jgi:hypothetical protein
MKTRVNNSSTFSGIIRFLDFDIPSGKTTVLISNSDYAPSGEIHEIDYDFTQRLIHLGKNPNHGKVINATTMVVDRWIIKKIQNMNN